jgi:tight adherence protein C
MELNNPFNLYTLLGVTFFSILILLYGINQAVKGAQRRRKIIQKIKNSQDTYAPIRNDGKEESGTFTRNILKIITGMGSRFSKKGLASHSDLRLRMLRAGVRNPKAAQIYWGVKIWTPIIFVFVYIVLWTYLPRLKLLSAPVVCSMGIATGILGFYLPELWLTVKAHIRRNKIKKDLPDALDLLVVGVEAGLGLDSAFNKVAEEMKMTSPQLSAEFKLLNLELRAGKPRTDALRNLSTRTNIDSFTSLVTLLIQTEKFGTSIAKALRVFSKSFRTKRFQIAEEVAAKLPVKMLIPMVFCIFPTFLAIMVGPAAISIWDNWLSKY